MAWNNSRVRRWAGGLALAGAVLLLVVGEICFKGLLSPLLFVCYWTFCLVFTSVALVCGVRELRAIQRNTIEEQKALFNETLREIEDRARERRKGEPET